MINISHPPKLLMVRTPVIFFVLSSLIWQSYGIASSSSSGTSGSAATSRAMGIEIETSSIKINNPSSDKVGFTLSYPSDLPRIILEEDTLDGTFSKTPGLEDFSQNIECKTVGGFKKEDLFIAARRIQLLLQNLYAIGAAKPFTVTIEWLQNLFDDSKITSRSDRPFIVKTKIVRKSEADSALASTASSSSSSAAAGTVDDSSGAHSLKEDDAATAKALAVSGRVHDVLGAALALEVAKSTVRPQLTYQLPLEDIGRLFFRLQSLGHRPISDFLKTIDPTIALPNTTTGEIKEKRSFLGKAFEENLKTQQEIRVFFKQNIAPVFYKLSEGKIKGFCLLFFYYWYELFNNKKLVNSTEPGVKQFLGVMSRLPFSQLYDSLSSDEKEKIKAILEPLVRGHGAQYRLRVYNDYDGQKSSPNLTIQDWYLSIIHDGHRQSINKRRVDNLSPPPNLNPDFDSMGALDIESNAQGLALIEARGYANMAYEDKPLSIMNFVSFIEKEVAWFFGE